MAVLALEPLAVFSASLTDSFAVNLARRYLEGLAWSERDLGLLTGAHSR